MLYQKNYFSALTGNLSTRSERAAQGLLSLGNPQLRQFLHDQLTASPGTPGAWLADPVFEPTFGWQESTETMSSLTGGNLLHQRLAKAMESPPDALAKEYAFPGNRLPRQPPSLHPPTGGMGNPQWCRAAIAGGHQRHWLGQNRMFPGASPQSAGERN